MKIYLVTFIICLLSITATGNQDKDVSPIITSTYNERCLKYENNPDIMVRPGLLADRKSKQVLVQAEATGLEAGSIAEFLLISQNSDHSYESVAISYAKPGDIRQALLFIGAEPGIPASPKDLRFSPKGERVFVYFSSTNSSFNRVPVEKMIINTRTGKPLPETGFVFTGSTLPDTTGVVTCAADTDQPCAIVANYNEPNALLNVPRNVPQKEFYGQQVVNAKYLMPTGQILEVSIEPEYKKGNKRVLDLLLHAKPDPKKGISYDMTDSRQAKLLSDAKLSSVFKKFKSLLKNGQTPFVCLQIDDCLILKDISDLCSALARVDVSDGINVEPPLSHHLYYRAFIPNERFRNRTERISQPWELLLKKESSAVSGTLVQIEQIWQNDKMDPDLNFKEYTVASPSLLRDKLKEIGPGSPAVFVFANGDLSHGELLDFISPVTNTHPMIHVFLN